MIVNVKGGHLANSYFPQRRIKSCQVFSRKLCHPIAVCTCPCGVDTRLRRRPSRSRCDIVDDVTVQVPQVREKLHDCQEPAKALPTRAQPSRHRLLHGLRRRLREPAGQGRARADAAPRQLQDVAKVSVIAGRVLRLPDAHQGPGEGQRAVEHQTETLALKVLVFYFYQKKYFHFANF